MDEDLKKRLQQLTIEDNIWILYIGIIIISLYSNYLERKYFIYKDNISRKKYKELTTLVFSILLVVYIYFLKDSIDSIRSLKENDSYKKKKLVYLSFLASLLITISGLLFLYISIVDNDLSVELAFN